MDFKGSLKCSVHSIIFHRRRRATRNVIWWLNLLPLQLHIFLCTPYINCPVFRTCNGYRYYVVGCSASADIKFRNVSTYATIIHNTRNVKLNNSSNGGASVVLLPAKKFRYSLLLAFAIWQKHSRSKFKRTPLHLIHIHNSSLIHCSLFWSQPAKIKMKIFIIWNIVAFSINYPYP